MKFSLFYKYHPAILVCPEAKNKTFSGDKLPCVIFLDFSSMSALNNIFKMNAMCLGLNSYFCLFISKISPNKSLSEYSLTMLTNKLPVNSS